MLRKRTYDNRTDITGYLYMYTCEVLEIECCNSVGEMSTHDIREFRITKEKGTEYLEGYYFNSDKSYPFRIDGIKRVRQLWTKILILML